ncbi:hypothetical protein V8F20_005576, partial [Naviculisporaceae sp. PSN 640]
LYYIFILKYNIYWFSCIEGLTYNWRLAQHNPLPDIGAYKLCRDFDALMRWQEEVEVKDEPAKWEKMVKPDDAVDLPMPAGLDQLVVTGYSKSGFMLKKLSNITRPDDCPSPVSDVSEGIKDNS